MTEGTLEKPYPLGDRSAPPIKCLNCDSKSFAIHLPKNFNEEYKESIDQEERETMFPKLFKDPLDTGEYYYRLLVTCAKCGDSPADEQLSFKALGDWIPPQENKQTKC
jgi:hypothetical protein